MEKNLYLELRNRQQKRFDDFCYKYAFFAFNRDQLLKGFKKLGITEEEAADKLYSMGGGGFYLREKAKEFHDIVSLGMKEREDAAADPETGDKYLFQMFYFELNNHEYSYTGEMEETLDSLGYTWEDVKSDQRLAEALYKASRQIMREADAE